MIVVSGLLSKCEEDDELGEGEVVEGSLTYKGEYGHISGNFFTSKIKIIAVVYYHEETYKTTFTYFK